MILVRSALLQHGLALVVHDKNRKGPMKLGFFMGFHFGHGAYLNILGIDQNNMIFFQRNSFFRSNNETGYQYPYKNNTFIELVV